VFASDSRFLAGGLALAFVALPGSAALAQDTETLTVSATVDATCELEGGSLDFGTYTSAGGVKEATGSFSYTCSPGASIALTLDGGSHLQDGNTRAMTGGGGGFLEYQLFTDPARTDEWEISTVGLQVSETTGGSTDVQVYGRIPANQQVSPGDYSDNVTITLNVN
jgi:spore coat protein U-like protein